MALELKARVKVNTAEVDEAEGKLTRFAEHFEHHFMRHFSRLAGSLAVITAFFEGIKEIFSKPIEVDKTAKKFGFTTDEVQLLTKAGEEMGLTFEEVLARARKGAIDLGKTLADMRKKHPDIMSAHEVETIAKQAEHGKKVMETIINRGRNLATLGYDILFSNKKGDEIRKYHPAFTSWMAKHFGTRASTAEEEHGAAEAAEGGGKHGRDYYDKQNKQYVSAGMARDLAIGRMTQDLQAFDRRRLALENRPAFELLSPHLTSRQQVGAYAGTTASIVQKLDEQTQELKDVKQVINTIRLDLEKLSQGG